MTTAAHDTDKLVHTTGSELACEDAPEDKQDEIGESGDTACAYTYEWDETSGREVVISWGPRD